MTVESRAALDERKLMQFVFRASFTRFRRVAETPFNHVFEARP